MSDERIVAYLRSRAAVSPPFDFVPSVVGALDDAPPHRAAWFAPFVPGAAAVGIAVAVTAIAFLVNQDRNVGPDPDPSAAPSPTVAESPTGDPTPSVVPSTSPEPVEGDLLHAGDRVDLDIRSVEGVSGSITLRREMDVGGYALVPEPNSETHFFVEIRVTYELETAPETASWGEVDWRVEGPDGPVGVDFLVAVVPPGGRGSLGTWPGATVPEERYEGFLIFVVPRDLADTPLDLLYQPPGVADAVRIPLREPGDAPPPVAAEWPRPAPVYVEQPGLPFTVLESAEADALFEDPDTCTNPEDGYTVTYPDSWYTNTAAGSVPACSWFSPVFYELTDDGSRPPEIAVEITVFSGDIGFIWADLYSENVTLDGVDARRYETGETKDPMTPTDRFAYSYLAYLDDVSEGRKLWAFTGVDYGGNYELNKAVFDRIMASFRFTD